MKRYQSDLCKLGSSKGDARWLAMVKCIDDLSTSQLSGVIEGLDQQVKQFKNIALLEENLFGQVDAIYEKVLVENQAYSVAHRSINVEGDKELWAC